MDNIKILHFVLGPVATNCYIMINTETKEAIIIDPAANADRLSAEIVSQEVSPVAILLTHGHFDHIMAVNELKDKYDIPVYAHEDEEDVLKMTSLNMSTNMGVRYVTKADHYLKDGDRLELAGFNIIVYHTPGHTKGGVCYYLPEQKILFSGDTLFHYSIGRTDFPTGSMSTLVRSIKEKLFVLPDDVQVLTGHEDMTTIGFEKKYNPFLQ